jgi:hypothetical protein
MTVGDSRDRSTGTLPGLVRPRPGWPVRFLGVLIASGGLWLESAPVGIAVGAGLAVGAVRLRGWTLFALGQIGLIAAVPRGAPLVSVALVETGLVVLLAGDAGSPRESVETLLETGVPVAGLGLLAWALRQWLAAIWPIALGLVIAVAVTGYGLHRYERLLLGYLEESS